MTVLPRRGLHGLRGPVLDLSALPIEVHADENDPFAGVHIAALSGAVYGVPLIARCSLIL